jgi:PKHD-type hydroxylase
MVKKLKTKAGEVPSISESTEKEIYQGTWPFHIDKTEPWAWQEQVFTPEECKVIIDLGKKNLQDALINNENKHNKDIRDSKISWISPGNGNEWIFQRLTDVLINLNDQYFKFELFGFAEGLQFTQYTAPGGKYREHVDSMYNGKIRKLSMTVQLSDEGDYEGGDFIINQGEEKTLPKNQGTLFAFPSYVLHGVKPVTKGTRYSLVAWISGPQFK